MAEGEPNSTIEKIESAIYVIRGQRVMLDSDLARIYGVAVKRLNEQLKRNIRRFPSDFAFQLTAEEHAALRSQIATSKKTGRGGRRYLPWVFTEHGALMLANVLNSEVAIEASIRVIRAFVRMREMLLLNQELAAKLGEIERRLDSHDESIAQLFEAIHQLLDAPEPEDESKREIGFHAREESPHFNSKRKA